MTRAALALGSNLGDRLEHLREAVQLLSVAGVRVVVVSDVYETDPVGGPEQGPYLNAVVVVDTDLEPAALLVCAQAAEQGRGRERLERWGPRTLDVDILAYEGVVSDDPVLTLPHPRAAERGFVLVPWAQVDPDFVVPGLGRSVADLLGRLPAEATASVRRSYDAERIGGRAA